MPTINYNAALPAFSSISGRSSIDINKWVSELKFNINSLIKSLFANGEQGFVFDPNDLSTMFQDAAGTIPVTGAGQPVGLVLDKSKGLVFGSELTPQAALWTGSANWTVDVQNAKATLVNSSVSSDDLSLGGVSASYVGKVFEIRFRILSISGGTVTVDSSRLLGVAPPKYSSPGMYRYFAYASNTGEGVFRININTAGVSCVIDNISVRELPGNHAYQTNAASRPILRQNAITGAYYLEFDGSDDFLTVASMNFSSTDELNLFVGLGRPSTPSAIGVLLELSSTIGANTGTFYITAPDAPHILNSIAFASYGTNLSRATIPDYTELSAVVAAQAKISTNTNTVHLNGVQMASNTGNQGTGNYGNYPLYIGRRGGSAYAFNGHIYSLIGIGRLATAIETAAIEKELAKRTGVTLSV